MTQRPGKDPWLAVNLSMFFPGLGQFYAGANLEGSLVAIAQLLLTIIALRSIFASSGNTVLGLFCLLAIASLYVINLFRTYHCVYGQYATPPSEKIPRTQKNPWFAVFLSRILPGLGQFYIQKAVLGGCFLGLTFAFAQLDELLPVLIFVTPAIAAASVYHAYVAFPRRLPSPALAAIMAGIVFLLGLGVNYLPYWIDTQLERFDIPSGSMEPTLQIGDRIFVRPYGNQQPQRGDIVVFATPEAAQTLDPEAEGQPPAYYIKRVIGRPGERVRVDRGVLYLNDLPLPENYIAEPPTYPFAEQTIPPSSYFVLGDNRNYSFDSHIWGVLPAENLVGRAYKIYWPPHRIRSLLGE